MFKRGSGVLLHISSLPGDYGIGDLGPGAYHFIDFLSKAKQSYWQILPVAPTCPFMGNSPYSSHSAFAGNKLFISPELLLERGFVTKTDISYQGKLPSTHVDYIKAQACKDKILKKAFVKQKDTLPKNKEFVSFCDQHAYWLDDFALFASIRQTLDGLPWNKWPDELKSRTTSAMVRAQSELADDITEHKFYQFLFFAQWIMLRHYAHEKDIKIVGDLPIYVNYDSVEVWSHPDIFKLDQNKEMEFLAGVPPDYFSQTGQLWGNPIYNWDALEKLRFSWWIDRLKHKLELVDILRFDHFRGFVGYWQVPKGETTAINGQWVEAPAGKFLQMIRDEFKDLPIIAEDLGVITDDVREVMKQFKLPGMKVLQFAFSDDLETHIYLPHNYEHNCVVYTGTHDNNTVKGWYMHDVGDKERANINTYMEEKIDESSVHQALTELALNSIADIAIIPMQDILGLGAEARMNKPGTPTGNWEWRLDEGQLTDKVVRFLKSLTKHAKR
jgi:4-alpha-glucanotransferase